MEQLRKFSAYGKNANAGVSLVTNACQLANIDGNLVTGAAGQYLQIHDKATAPINGDVPVRSYYLPSSGPANLPSIFQQLGPVVLSNGLGVAISSTDGTLTLGAGSFDVFGEIEEFEFTVPGLSTAGDLTTGVNSLIVWTNAAGPQRLFRIDAIVNVSAYLMIFATNLPSNGDTPEWSSGLITPSATVVNKFVFGYGGLWTRQFASGVLSQACFIVASTTPGVLTGDVTNACKIRAQYKVA